MDRACVGLLLGLLVIPAVAGGARSVNGAGVPMAWDASGAVIYNPDQGGLGSLSNATARSLLSAAFAEWASVGVISFTEGSLLPQNVNAAGIPATNTAHWRHFYRKGGDGRSPVIFDEDGSIIDSLFGAGARFDILGVAGIETSIGAVTEITEASVIINGAFIDGAGLPGSPEDLSQTAIQAVMVHEIGHFLNLDHSVLNHELALDGNAGNDIYVPTMYPVAVTDEEALASINPDDEIALRMLYDPGAPATAISGSIMAGGIPFQGANVVLRKTDDPQMTAYSVISGGLYYPCNPGGSCDCEVDCPANPPEQGTYAAQYLAPGGYTVCIEQIDTRFTQSSGSFVGPLATPPILPGPEECYSDVEFATEDPDDVNAVSDNAAGTNIVINSLPLSDAFEPNNTFGTAATLDDLPAGRDTAPALLGSGDVDVYAVPVTAGQRVRIDVEAAEIGSALDAVVGFYNDSNALVALVDDAFDPDSQGYSFDPALELTAGFTGTAKVVVSSFPDMDQNGSGGTTTGPYWIRIEVVSDSDGDGAGDAVDICPATARDDEDRDGFCFGADDCPTLANPFQVPANISGSLAAGGDVGSSFQITPDQTRAVFIADKNTDGVDELYSVAVGGGTVTRLNGTLVLSGDVEDFRITATGARVVYRADQDTDGILELYSVAVSGGTATKLIGTLANSVSDYAISSDSATVVYRAEQDAVNVSEVYSVPITGGATTKLNGVLTTSGAGGDVLDYAISPNSARVVYRADQDTDGVLEIYSVPIGGGSPAKLNGALPAGGFVLAYSISPDSARVVYRADQETDNVFELYSVPIAGGSATKLNAVLPSGGDVVIYAISPNSARVVYTADQDTNDVLEIYSVLIAGGTAIKLNGVLVSEGDVTTGAIDFPFDSSIVVYVADQDTDEVLELYSAPITGGGSTKISGTMVAGGAVHASAPRLIPPFSPLRVIYLADQDTDGRFELYSVPIGGGAGIKLNVPVGGTGVPDSFSLGPDASVLYLAGPNDLQRELYAAPMNSSTSFKLSGTLQASGTVESFAVNDEPVFYPNRPVIYQADQETDDRFELYRTDFALDFDGDGIRSPCDLCSLTPDPNQDDGDGNGIGDACAGCALGTDPDADVVCGAADNCPSVSNGEQDDFDSDGLGDACDVDDDDDGLADIVETNTGIFVGENDTGTDPFDADTDGDGVSDGDELQQGSDPTDPGGTGLRVPFAPQAVISTAAAGAYSVLAVDIDGDGDTDVLSASYSDDTIAWYENNGTSPPIWTARTISTAADGAVSVFAADVDGDGDKDVLSASYIDAKIAWYENNGALPPVWTTRTISTSASGARSVFAADVDGDGDVDALSASEFDDTIAWYENDGASPPAWTARTISTAADGPGSVFVADVDGDGDMDVLSASLHDDKIAWYENDGASPPVWTAQTISTTADKAYSVFAVDIDGDGDTDVLSASFNDGKIAWYENDGASLPNWTARTISIAADGTQSVFAGDVDGDGDTDVLSVSGNNDTIDWYENDRASPPTWTARSISTAALGAVSVFAADVDGDGDTDVVAASYYDDTIAWYENKAIHRSAAFPAQSLVSSGFADWVSSVVAADVDSDGDTDVLSASTNNDKIAWYENNGASPPNFTARNISIDVANGARSVFAADLDGDGHVDTLSASWDLAENEGRIAWFKNDGASPPVWTPHLVVTTAQADGRAVWTVAADVDGDGDQDIVSAWSADGPSEGVTWYENLDGMGTFGPAQVIYQFDDLGIQSVVTADLDGDGDTDVISGSRFGNKTAWYENDGTPGGLGDWAEHRISFPSTITSVFAADVNGDGDIDVVSASEDNDEVVWYENDGTPAVGGDWTARHIATLDFTRAVFATDMDGDGDMDVLSASETEDKVAWYENDGASPPGWSEHGIVNSLQYAVPVFAADMDRDGDPDVLCAEWIGTEVAWYENRGGQFTASAVSTAPAQVIDGATVHLMSVNLTHEGRVGDSAVDLVRLELLLEESPGNPLSSIEANALLDRLRIFLDDGDGLYEPGTDLPVTTIETLAPSPQAIAFQAGDPRMRLQPGALKRYLIVGDLALGASSAAPNSFRLRLSPASDLEVRDVSTGVLLDGTFSADVSTGTISVIADVTRPSVTGVFPSSGTIDAALSTDVVLILSERVDPASAALGVSLSAGGVKLSGSVSVSADGTVISFDPAAMLTVNTDYLVQVTTALTDRSGNPALPFSATFDTTANASAGDIEASEVGEAAAGRTLTGQNADDNSGFAASALGDINGDGIADLMIGAPNADIEYIDAGRAVLVFGAPGLQSNSAAVTRLSYVTLSTGDFVAETVARAGDLDNDGIQDFLIGAPRSDLGVTGAGVVYLVFGDAGLDEAAPAALDLNNLAACGSPTLCGVKFLGDAAGDLAGASISYAGDINNDGIDDVVIGAPGASPGGRFEAGRAYLIYGPLVAGVIDLGTVGTTTPGLVLNGETADDHLGASVSHWEDDTGDGVDDLLVGAPGATALDEFGDAIDESGYVYAIQGGTGPGHLDDAATPGVIELSRVASGQAGQVAGMVFLGAEPNGHIGRSLTGAVDSDGNGIDDVIFSGNGQVFAIPGDGPKTVIGGTRSGGSQEPQLGLSRSLGELDALQDFGAVVYQAGAGNTDPLTVGPAGDINNDGVEDFIIGAPLADGPAGADAGKAYIVLGSPAPGGEERHLADIGQTLPGIVLDGAEAGDNLGSAVGGGFDLNADGVDDGLVGAPFADTDAGAPQDTGETYVISPIQPEEVLGLRLSDVGIDTRLEWSVPDLAAVYNVYRGLLSTLRATKFVRTSDMIQLACGVNDDANGNQLPDLTDAANPPGADGFTYLVTAENLHGEGPLGPPGHTPLQVNDQQCP